ncbi:hypothetical protein QF034_007603 [Streptomyces africanus]|uniref:Uncharacterized protein n=1 Tax=Streptomyces africanus TaxID=231024 RepID=A0ABU0R416_9ACTN|nr:hypothetical protein [Streptomyces africanus]MDQ0753372.1 hypothetical protein [Streptomyces africanus]
MAEGLAEGGTACAATRGGEDPPPDRSPDAFERVSAVADAVLYEGYLLYPYRRSSAKNRVRWQFGVLFPRDWVEADGSVAPGVSGSADSWYQQTECLLRIRRPGSASVRVRIRHLQMQRKQVEESREGRHHVVESLRTADGTTHLTFDEAVPREREVEVPLDELLRGGHTVPVVAAAGVDVEPLPGHAGRVVRHRDEVRADITVTAEQLSDDLCRLRVRTTNTGPAPEPRTARDEALRRALIATHTLIGGDGVEFVSLIDPPTDLSALARSCRNEFTFPVLGGDDGDVLLSAPIILPDHPQVAPESPGDLHDAAEIDEILTLRTMLLTDEEKREARATDPRAAAILDRVDTMPQEVFERLHGAVRSLTPATPATAAPAGAAPATLAPAGAAPVTPALATSAAGAPATPAPGTAALATSAPGAAAPVTPAPVAPVPGTAAPVPVPGTAASVTPATGTPAPVTPAPVAPVPGAGAPVTSAPATPAPGVPDPVTPAPVTPAPGTPAPVTPTPGAPAPVTPVPATPTPAPAAPVPGTAVPRTSAPGAPAPVTPVPVTPVPGTPAPVTPTPGAPALMTPAPAPPAPTPPTPTDRPAWWQEGADDGLSPVTDTVLVGGVPLGGGSRVRLCPRGRGADAQDMFLAGRTAEVAAVFHDVDGSVHLAVTLDDDPAAELHSWYGRFHYFRPDELEPLEPAGSPDEPSAPAPAAAPSRHTTDSETPAAEAE